MPDNGAPDGVVLPPGAVLTSSPGWSGTPDDNTQDTPAAVPKGVKLPPGAQLVSSPGWEPDEKKPETTTAPPPEKAAASSSFSGDDNPPPMTADERDEEEAADPATRAAEGDVLKSIGKGIAEGGEAGLEGFGRAVGTTAYSLAGDKQAVADMQTRSDAEKDLESPASSTDTTNDTIRRTIGKGTAGFVQTVPEALAGGAAVAMAPEAAGLALTASLFGAGAGGMDAVTHALPNIQDELRATPDDTSGAITRGLEKTGVESVITAGTFALLHGTSELESPILSYLGIGAPAIVAGGAGQRAAENVIDGRPAGEGVAEGVKEDAIQAGLMSIFALGGGGSEHAAETGAEERPRAEPTLGLPGGAGPDGGAGGAPAVGLVAGADGVYRQKGDPASAVRQITGPGAVNDGIDEVLNSPPAEPQPKPQDGEILITEDSDGNKLDQPYLWNEETGELRPQTAQKQNQEVTPPTAPKSASRELTTPVPQRPRTIIDDMKGYGGLAPSDETRARNLHTAFPGLVRGTGKSDDYMREALSQDGYFGYDEDGSPAQGDRRELWNMIDNHTRSARDGNPNAVVWSPSEDHLVGDWLDHIKARDSEAEAPEGATLVPTRADIAPIEHAAGVDPFELTDDPKTIAAFWDHHLANTDHESRQALEAAPEAPIVKHLEDIANGLPTKSAGSAAGASRAAGSAAAADGLSPEHAAILAATERAIGPAADADLTSGAGDQSHSDGASGNADQALHAPGTALEASAPNRTADERAAGSGAENSAATGAGGGTGTERGRTGTGRNAANTERVTVYDAAGRPVTAEQYTLDGTARSAVQLAASRDAAGHGKIVPRAQQKEPDHGLFAAPDRGSEQPVLFETPRATGDATERGQVAQPTQTDLRAAHVPSESAGAEEPRVGALSEVSQSASDAESGTRAAPVDPWDMTGEQLRHAVEAKKVSDKNTDVDVLGVDRAKQWNDAHRRANSSNPETSDRGQAEVDAIEKSLTESQYNRLYGVGETDHSADTLNGLARAVGNIEGDSETAESLGDALRWAVTKVGDETDPHKMTISEREAYAQLRRGYEIAKERGFDTSVVTERALRGAAKRFSDPNDAAFMLRRYIRDGEPTPRAGTRQAPVAIERRGDIQAARDAVDKNPSAAQIEAGNYQHGHATWNGLPISIETVKGAVRKSKPGQPKWEVKMPTDYGYVKGTMNADGEHVDIHMGPNPKSKEVYVIAQKHADTGKFDEYKVMAGFDKGVDAIKAYDDSFSDGKGPDRRGPVAMMDVDQLKSWLDSNEPKSAPLERGQFQSAVPKGWEAAEGNPRNPNELEIGDKRVTTHGQLRAAANEQHARALTNPELAEFQRRIEKYFSDIGLDKDVGHRLVDSIRSVSENGEATVGNQGMYLRKMIYTALDTKTSGRDTAVRHEVVHALRSLGLITDPEWEKITAAATRKGGWMDLYDIRRRYGHLSEEKQVEEAAAEAYRYFTGGAGKWPWAQAIFNKIRNGLIAVGRALRMIGIREAKDVDDLFSKIDKGEVGRRPRTKTRDGAAQYARGDDPAFGEKFRGGGKEPPEPPKRGGGKGDQGKMPSMDFTVPDKGIVKYLKDSSLKMMDRIKGAATEGARVDLNSMRNALQDNFRRVKQYQDAITEARGGEALPEKAQPYLMHENMPGRTGARLDRLKDEYVEPLVEKIAESGIPLDEVERFLYAKHAAERDAQIAKINPEIPEGGSGWNSDKYGTPDFYMENIAPEKRAHLEDISTTYREMMDHDLTNRVADGLLTEQDATRMRRTYKNYVPLKGPDELEGDDLPTPNTGQGISVRGKEYRRAMGRQSEATNLLAHSVMQAEEGIIRGERVRPARALLRLAELAPNPKVWEIDKVDLKPVINRATGLVERRPARVLSRYEETRTVRVKVNGQEHRLIIHDDRLVKDLKALHPDQTNAVLRAGMWLNRKLSTVNTALNPEFLISNAIRDASEAFTNLQQYEKDAMVKAIAKDYFKAIKGSWGGLVGKEATEWQKHFQEYKDAGGKIEFFKADNLGEHMANINKMMEDRVARGLYPMTKKMLGVVRETVDRMNGSIENGIRLSTFVNARKAGMSPDKAASIARNLTVNFNRHGHWGPTINGLYLFANAGIQGTATMLHAMRNRNVRRIVYGIIGLGVVSEIANTFLSAPSNEDGKSEYDKIQEYVKDHNLILMTPWSKTGMKMPLPFGYGFFHSLGRNIAAYTLGNQDMGETVTNLLGTFTDAFSPLGNAASWQNAIAPTILDPVVDISRNKDFTGRNIVPDKVPSQEWIPQSQRYYRSTSATSKFVSEWLNHITGGNKYEKGGIDLSPQYLDYAWSNIMGGMGQFISRAVQMLGKLLHGDANWNDIPFARRFLIDEPTYADRTAFYDHAKEIEEARSAVKGVESNGTDKEFDEVHADKNDLADLYPSVQQTRKELRNIAIDRADLDENDQLSIADKQKATKQLQQRETDAISAFDKDYQAYQDQTNPKRAVWRQGIQDARKRIQNAIPGAIGQSVQ